MAAVGELDCPRVPWLQPAEPNKGASKGGVRGRLARAMRPASWITQEYRLFFVCPVTMTLADTNGVDSRGRPVGYSVTLPTAWWQQHGQLIRGAMRVLATASSVALSAETRMCDELFGPVLTVTTYKESEYEATLKTCDATSEYALTGSIFAQCRRAVRTAHAKDLQHRTELESFLRQCIDDVRAEILAQRAPPEKASAQVAATRSAHLETLCNKLAKGAVAHARFACNE